MTSTKLNLLSPEQKEYLRFEHLYLYVRTVTFLLLSFSLIIAGLFLTARLILQDNYAQALTSTTLVTTHNSKLDHDVNQLNKNLQQIEGIQKGFIKWSRVLTELTRTIPPNVEITSLSIDQKMQTFTLTGRATKRDDFLKLKDNLSHLPYLKNLSSPLTNLLLREDVSFQFSAAVVSEALNQPLAP